MARGTDTPKGVREEQALAWLGVWRTSRQIADLLGITPNHASALCRRLWIRGDVERAGRRPEFRYRRAS